MQTALDRWWARVLRTPTRLRLWYWGGPLLVTLLAAVLRLWDLAHPHQLVFDETYYVKDAYTLSQNGYESRWPDNPDRDFNAGITDGFLSEGSYVVHPPLGKWLISLGINLFGASDSFGWRITTALAGTLAVFLLILVARILFRSTLVAVITGFLFAIDGNAIVMSRVALLDTWLMLFCLLGFWFVLLDRGQHARRLRLLLVRQRRKNMRRNGDTVMPWGPAIWARPWLLAAGAAFGCACAVKWSGLYVLAGFGIYVVIVDALARRRTGVQFWFSAALLKQAPVTLLLLVPIAFAVYLASWTGWFITDGGFYRHWAEIPANAATGMFAWIPDALQSLWHYHVSAYQYHLGVTAPHSAQSNPFSWLLMIHPVNMFYQSVDGGNGAGGSDGCGATSCVQAILDVGNPLIWWAAALACGYLVYRLVRYREWQVGSILAGVAVTYLPWLLYTGRTVFQFYSIAFQPFTMLALGYVISVILGSRNDPPWRRDRGVAIVIVFLSVTLLISAYFYPLWTGQQTSLTFWQLHIWLPSWR